MNMKLKIGSLRVVVGIGLVGFIAGCPIMDGTVPPEFTNADATRGGALYDK
jgi:hypothetical protein